MKAWLWGFIVGAFVTLVTGAKIGIECYPCDCAEQRQEAES